MRCPACRIPLKSGLVSVRYRGEGRHLSVTLNGVPAQVCPDCRRSTLEPEVERQLEDLSETMAVTAGPMRWHIDRVA